jgi:hypothetical protein
MSAAGGTVRCENGLIHFFAGGTNYDLLVPASTITYSPLAVSASTSFNVGTGEWETVVPVDYSGNVFLAGRSFAVGTALPGGINPVTWSGTFMSDVAGAQFQWKWAAAVYTSFSADYNTVGAKPIDGSSLNPYHNSDHAGTPENFKPFVIGGARGGGGSNFTGSYSGTASADCH